MNHSSSSRPSQRPATNGHASRPAPQRSLSVQATSTARSNGYSSSNGHAPSRSNGGVPPRKPLQATINSRSASGNGRVPNGNSLSVGGPGRFDRSISADPNLNDPAIQAKIGNRATKVVQKSIGKNIPGLRQLILLVHFLHVCEFLYNFTHF